MVEEAPEVRRIFSRALFIGIYVGTEAKAQKYLDEWLVEYDFVASVDSENYKLTLPVEKILDFMVAHGAFKNISDIDDWDDILYAITNIEESTISVEDAYAYDEEAAKEELKDELTELFGEEE